MNIALNQIQNKKDDETYQQSKKIESLKEEYYRDKDEIAKLRELLNKKEKDWLDKKTMYESDCQEINIQDQLRKIQSYIDQWQ